MTFSLAC